MEEKMWSNPEAKDLLIKLIIIMIIFAVTGSIIFNLSLQKFSGDIIDKNVGVIGNIITKHPELKNEIISSYTKEPSVNELKEGEKVAESYGYEKNLSFSYFKVLNSFHNISIITFIVFMILLFITFFSVVYFAFKNVFLTVNKFAKAAEDIVEGDFSIKFSDEKEGALSKLSYQFDQMSNRLELTLEELKKEKNYLKNITSDISHQLKTPLSSIKMFNELLIDGAINETNVRDEFLNKCRIEIERMEWLIKSLLQMARLDAGAVEFKNESFPINKTIISVIDGLSLKLKEKNQNIVFNNSSDILLIHDRRWLGEAISNIIKNGIEHTGEGGSIQIKLEETNIFIRVTLIDNGEGISLEDMPHIFERFYKGKNNSDGGGTGIGLTLSKSIVENQNGMIKVKSEVNRGTTFILTFLKGIV